MVGSTKPLTNLTDAFKEWAIAVEALCQGEMILLLRKGGIREQSGVFRIEQLQAWLYPTYEHQKPHLLKPKYADRVTPVASGWHPDHVNIQAWAAITHVFQVSDLSTVEALLPFHIWNLDFASERLKWKPKSPLSVLLLRVYCLPQPHPIIYRPEYGGCKSWIQLQEAIPTTEACPVLNEEEYLEQVKRIRSVLAVDE
ncbi:DUF1802 family protein [Thermocoleostomius sinensis]|uniref:DUF1802 family protein n=1 Tax=Thermocoleostomius sinensis A174 TaxID=2016057 RepID=A0A9E8ZEB3_9CYAN|nr:DUF1802 family protein [Thermocoleostomius sinensis]WAL61573.1 DUF1802 family protein [Thermocoleostomius sinensis A174]